MGVFLFCRYQSPFSFRFFLSFFSINLTVFRFMYYYGWMGGLVRVGVILFPFPFFLFFLSFLGWFGIFTF